MPVPATVSAASGGLSTSLACDDPQVGLKTKSSAVGLALGAELGVPAGSGRVTFNARYTLGLNTIDNGGLNLDVKSRAWTILAGYAVALGRGAPSPSIAAPGDGGGIPALAVGVSVFDFNERASTGALLKATVWERSFLDMAAIGHRWPTLGGGSGWAGGLEAGYYPVGRGVIVPQVALGVGYIRALPPPGYIGEISGVTTSLGLGARAQIAHLQLGAEALIRDDAGLHGDAELRFLGGYAPALRPDSVHGSAGVFLLAMVPLHGPWRFTEPGYEARLTTGLSERYAGSLSLALLHWRIASSGSAGGYLWDTRAVLVEPGCQWSRGGGGGRGWAGLARGRPHDEPRDRPAQGGGLAAHDDVRAGSGAGRPRGVRAEVREAIPEEGPLRNLFSGGADGSPTLGLWGSLVHPSGFGTPSMGAKEPATAVQICPAPLPSG